MQELQEKSVIEAEIAELSRAIEEKKARLESAGENYEKRDLVRESLREKILDVAVPAVPVTVVAANSGDYVDNLDDASREKVTSFIERTFLQGISKTLGAIVHEEPYIIDAYHDALVDKLYDELVNRKII